MAYFTSFQGPIDDYYVHPVRKAGRLDYGSGEVEGDVVLGPGGHREEAAGEAAGDPEAAADVQLGIQVRAADDLTGAWAVARCRGPRGRERGVLLLVQDQDQWDEHRVRGRDGRVQSGQEAAGRGGAPPR